MRGCIILSAKVRERARDGGCELREDICPPQNKIPFDKSALLLTRWRSAGGATAG